MRTTRARQNEPPSPAPAIPAFPGGYVSWILSVIAGIVAIVLGVVARKQASPRLGLALAGIVIGVLCILSSLALVGIYLLKLKNMGLL